MTMCIIEINENDNIRAIMRPQPGSDEENTEQDTREILRRFAFQFPEPTMIGTQVRNNKRLILIDIDGDVDEFMESVTTDEEPQPGPGGGGGRKKNLRWKLIAREGERITGQGQLINYFNDIPLFDYNEDGELVQVGSRRPTLEEALQVWAGKQWTL